MYQGLYAKLAFDSAVENVLQNFFHHDSQKQKPSVEHTLPTTGKIAGTSLAINK